MITKLNIFMVVYSVFLLVSLIALAEDGDITSNGDSSELATALNRVSSYPAAKRFIEERAGIGVMESIQAIFVSNDVGRGARCGAAYVLGCSGDDAGFDALVKHISQELPEWFSDDDLAVFRCAIEGIAFSHSLRATNLLIEMLSSEYWITRGGAPTCPDRRFTRDKTTDYLRYATLDALASSGSEAAIEALARGDKIPEDLESARQGALSTAVYRNLNIWNIPDDIRTLGPEVSGAFFEKWKEIETKYGYKWKTPE